MDQLSMIGWLGNAFLAAGIYGVAKKKHNAFLLAILGQALWIIKSACLGMWDLSLFYSICLLLVMLTYCKWK